MKDMKLNKITQATNPSAKDLQKGFSLPSVIVGSIIAAVLGGMALTSMWGSVDKATIAAEVASIAEVKTLMAGVREDVSGFPSAMDTNVDEFVASRAAQMPKEFKYQLVLLDGGGSPYIALKATAADAKGRDRLNAIVADLNLRYDGVDGTTTTDVAGKFIYDTTCLAPGTRATAETDCYYATPVMARSTMPTDMTHSTDVTRIKSDLSVDGNVASPLN